MPTSYGGRTVRITRGAAFHERLYLNATPADEPRRARLHPRQAFAYSHANELGWAGPASRALEHGLDFFVSHYKRNDGFYRTRVSPDGSPSTTASSSTIRRSHCWALHRHTLRAMRQRWRTEAYALHARLEKHFRRAGGGFEESIPARLPLTSNSHMHLLEAALAWRAADTGARWPALATEIIQLAQTRLDELAQRRHRRAFRRRMGAAAYAGVDHRARPPVRMGIALPALCL